MKLVPQNFHALRKKWIGCGYGSAHVPQPLRFGAKLRNNGEDAAHGPQPAITFNTLGEQHKAAALRIDGQPGFGPGRQIAQMRRGAECCGAVFGKTAAKIQAVDLAARRCCRSAAWHGPLACLRAHNLKPHQFRACAFQGFKIFLIIKPQGTVAHIGNAGALRGGIWNSRADSLWHHSHRPELFCGFCSSARPGV